MTITGRAVRRTMWLLAELYGTRCAKCGEPIEMAIKHPHPMSPSIGHQLPRSRGGSDAIENLRLEHLRCNERAGNKLTPRPRSAETGQGFEWLAGFLESDPSAAPPATDCYPQSP